MKYLQRFWYWIGIIMTLVMLVLGTYWIKTTQVQAASTDGTLLLSSSFKLVTPEEVSPGGTAHYAVVLRNSSPISSVNTVIIGDSLPALVSYVPNSAAVEPSGQLAGWDATTLGYITFTVSNLTPHGIVTCTFDAVVSQSVESGIVISNVATLDDGINLVTTAPATFTVSQPPVVQIASPTNGTVIKQDAGDVFTINGYAWSNFTPPPFLEPPTLLPLNSPDDDGTYYIKWTPVSLAENYIMREATSPDFQWTMYPAVSAPTVSQLITGKENGTYYYQVRTYSAQINASRWSNVQAITVAKTGLQRWFVPLPIMSFTPSRQIQNMSTSNDDIVVEVSVDDGVHWYSATITLNSDGWWDWSYDWTLPDEDGVPHILRSRAKYVGNGNYGTTDTIRVTIENSIHLVYLPLVLRRWPPIPYPATLNISANNVRGGNYTLSWSYDNSRLPPTSDSHYELQEATANDFNDTVVLCSPQITLCNSTKNMTIGLDRSPNVYYYRLRAWNSYGGGQWSNIQQVTVLPGVPYDPTLNNIDNTDTDGTYTLSWTYTHPDFIPSSYEVQEATDVNFTLNLRTPCTPEANTSCIVSEKEVGTYYYRVRGINGAGEGDWSNIQQVTVLRIVPYSPILNDIDNTDTDGTYTLSWTYTHPDFIPSSYEVQEATDVNFTLNLRTPCTPEANTSCIVSEKEIGTYYYRVRGINGTGEGDWSAVKSTTVVQINRIYNFNGSTEGWGIRRSDEVVDSDGNPIPQPASHNNALFTSMVGSGDFAIISPLQEAPKPPYTIVANVAIVNGETIGSYSYTPKDGMKYSIMFGANDGTPCPATESTPKNQGCFSHYYRLRVRWNVVTQNDSLAWSLQRIDYHEGPDNQGMPPVIMAEGTVNTNGNGWNKWTIKVLNTSGPNIKVYHGTHNIATVRDTHYINEPHFGVQIISSDWGSVSAKWDWFEVRGQ